MIARNLMARVELLSDVHIGTGTELVRDIDWIAPGDGFVYLAHPDRLLEEVFGRAEADGKEMREVARTLAKSTLPELRQMGWLAADDFGPVTEDHPLFRYRLRGAPATANIREQIKDVYGKPYLPGSSLKGALRTVLAVAGVRARELDAAAQVIRELDRVKRQREQGAQTRPNKFRADDAIETALFGQDPNHDLLRALQVADSAPVDADRLRLQRAYIYPTASDTYRGRSKGLDVDLETLAQGTVLELPIHVPAELLESRATEFDHRRTQELALWEQRADWLVSLARSGKRNAAALLEDEYRYWEKRTDAPATRRFYDSIIDIHAGLGKSEFLLVLGWGGGWHTKTLNQHLKKPEESFERIVTEYNLSPQGHRKPGDRFPKSRHLLRVGDKPGPPLGWVKVTLTPAS